MATWIVSRRSRKLVVSRMVGDKAIEMGPATNLYDALIDIVLQTAPYDIIQTPEGFSVVHKESGLKA